jgi:nitrate/TMAO reductase-like tetraheme cytochrome c subunit
MNEESEGAGTRQRRSWVLMLGAALVAIGFLSGLFLFVLEVLFEAAPYVGILYVAASILLVLGLLLLPLGYIYINGRDRGTGQRKGFVERVRFDFDLAKRAHLYGALAFVSITALVAGLLGVGSYKSYQATESTSFCGELCHSVMHPEWTTYQTSSHARVKCVECHIGAGANWFVRSKIDGLRQVWAVTVNSYSRPHRLRMLVKIGGEQTGFMKGSGIHYHMLVASKVEYIATDERRQEIGWVRVTRADGSVSEYDNTDNPLTDVEKATLEMRTMDCMDCHNRPAHQYKAPMSSVNMALEQGAIPKELPYVKLQAVKALNGGYETTDAAMTEIANHLRNFYRDEYPDILENGSEEVTQAIRAVQAIYRGSIFPLMNVDWSAYPDNIGHHYSPGCFRCHNDSMESSDGGTIFTTCNKCHLILAQGESIDEVNVDFRRGLRFVHPDDDETMDEYEECVDCHNGGGEVYE